MITTQAARSDRRSCDQPGLGCTGRAVACRLEFYIGGCSSSLFNHPVILSVFSGSGPSHSNHRNARVPLPPGGNARIRSDPALGGDQAERCDGNCQDAIAAVHTTTAMRAAVAPPSMSPSAMPPTSRHKIPTMYELPSYVDSGGQSLMRQGVGSVQREA
jgi:hypothetical protein